MHTPSSRSWRCLWLLLITTTGISLAPSCFSAGKPNVVLLYSDDHRADAVGYVPNPHIRTPNLDRLATRGLCMTRAYIMGGMQGAVCVPSRAMLMTSRSLFRIREDLAGIKTWPEQFAESGYRTFMTGKWHNGPKSAARVFPNAKSVFLGGMSGAYGSLTRDIINGQLQDVRTNELHHTELFALRAVEFIQSYTNPEPFLCYVAFKAPHDPRVGSPQWHEFYRTNLPPVPRNFLPEHPFDNGELKVRDEALLPWPRTRTAVQKELADYYASTSHVDEQVGKILDALEARGLTRNTIVAFAGDNGLAIGSHGLMGKQNLYDHSMRVPLVMAGPGITPRRSDALCYLQDVFPTIAELAELPPLPGVDGLSLVKVMQGNQRTVRDSIFTAYRNVQRALRTDQWKVIHYPIIDRWQFFDLSKDPLEMEDQSSNPELAKVFGSMKVRLKEQMQSLDDPLTRK